MGCALRLISAVHHSRMTITGYPRDAYDAALLGWHATDCLSCIEAGLVTEQAWTNLEPPIVSRDYDHLVMDSRQRKTRGRCRIARIRRLPRALTVERNAILASLAEASPDELRLADGRHGR